MSESTSLLARLFRRGRGGDLVGELYSRAMGQPLLVDPESGQALLSAYLRGPSPTPDREDSDLLQRHGQIGVIDVSGPLVHRAPAQKFCAPPSYEEIADAVDSAVDDAELATVVLRLDTPGGEAAGTFDLADRIRARRDDKRIIAVIDDRALSAGYAIASAASEVWISRTGRAGSIGVVTYHVDQSGLNEALGVRVEYIYAGERKVDGNPHQPLGDEARSQIQGEIDRLYDLFVETVAAGRPALGADGARATQAAVYGGQRAVDAGLADRVGTLRELLEEYTASTADGPSVTRMEAAAEPAPDAEPAPAAAQPDQPAPPTLEGTGEGEPLAELPDQPAAPATEADPTAPALTDSQTAEIRAVCAAAGLADVADDYIQAGTDPERVRADLLAATADTGPEVRSARSAEGDTGHTEQYRESTGLSRAAYDNV
ncbi:protein C Serine peptidase. MEROPS family S49 [Thiohalospira halophila DSM 15071]|uniref:Protein C Serine peptidase. MEROPS family S49 n=1 Tax=Thiohalospira halophila DSM 15071 TaxID=1123397 RepID=A0A1I1UAK5_9GAMM|nr:S49 family peptidase [Thiohalospira halophila]SFD67799.1 protein C Serine peptidase. MEROPS family S49 [Thiohalospira halophila DSM 15071]